MKRVIAFSVSVTAVLGLSTGIATAAQPANTACVGTSLSTLASDQPEPGAFGGAVVGFAQAPDGQPGLGDGIQTLQAGDVPDEVVPNTCN